MAEGIEKRRDGFTLKKLMRFLMLPFRPKGSRTWLAVNRFEDVPVDEILKKGIKGILLDADGTLARNKTEHFSESVVRQVELMREKGLQVAIYTNAGENRFQQFPGVEIVTGVPAKPDSRGFETAMMNFLQLDDPARVCMIGDNYITDGGAIDAGMWFIYVKPIAGNEHFIHRFFRYIAYLCARLHAGKQFRFLSSNPNPGN
ncbi:MAG: hypothetical protein VYC17_06025 [Nitrospinota bacterium]|nr:hypothetical protein [Nitrospinota bacterium]